MSIIVGAYLTDMNSAIVCAILTLVYRVKLLLSSDSMWLSAQLFICKYVNLKALKSYGNN